MVAGEEAIPQDSCELTLQQADSIDTNEEGPLCPTGQSLKHTLLGKISTVSRSPLMAGDVESWQCPPQPKMPGNRPL